MKISGRHKSVPRALKRALSTVLPKDAKVVMSDICSCRHNFSVGTLKVTENTPCTAKIRGYYGSGIVNFFVKFSTEADCHSAILKLQ